MGNRKLLGICVFALTILVLPAAPCLSEEGEHAEHSDSEGYQHHPNHFGGFLGTSIRTDPTESAPTLGLEYARVLSQKFALAGYVEMVSSSLERDIIIAAGLIYYPLPRFGLLLAPGIEGAEKEVTHHGETETETEVVLLLRAGIGYGFPIASNAAVGPTVMIDYSADRWTTVLGLSYVVGF